MYIPTSLTKICSAYFSFPSIDASHIYKKILISSFLGFLKNLNPHFKRHRGSHCEIPSVLGIKY